MKKGMYLLFLGLLLSFSSIAQTGINYKAYITDDLGNALVDQSIILEITIKIGDGMAIIYSESHNAMTDENGMVMINIGQGTPIIGDFTDILWGSDEHFLNVQVDIGSGLVDMGTTQFMSVPYALYAPSLGLEKIWEGGSPGWRLADTNPDAYGDIGLAATDISISLTSNNSTYGATGNYSFANGYQTTASGSQSMAGGLQTVASGLNSFAFGNYSKAEAMHSTALGSYNVGGGSADTWEETDPLFEVGNSIDGAPRSNALTVLKNGTLIAPSFEIDEIVDPKSLITKEYADANYSGGGGTGLEFIETGNGIGGWRLAGKDPANFGTIGINAVDLSDSFFPSTVNGATGVSSFAVGGDVIASGFAAMAIGANNQAIGDQSFAAGNGTIASGNYSVAFGELSLASGNNTIASGYNAQAIGHWASSFGQNTLAEGWNSFAAGVGSNATGTQSTSIGGGNTASGHSAVALGNGNLASGQNSTAFGQNTIASGAYSTAMGAFTKAESFMTTAIGRFNTGGGHPTSWDGFNPLFEIGNGFSEATRQNALIVFKNGTIHAPTFDLLYMTHPKSLVTKEYVDYNFENELSGLELIVENMKGGWRLNDKDPNNYGDIGDHAIDLSESNTNSTSYGATGDNSFAVGYQTTAAGQHSVALGHLTQALGSDSFAVGLLSQASGNYSVAMGNQSNASGENSIAFGNLSSAFSVGSIAIGDNAEASFNHSVAIGNETRAFADWSTALGVNTFASGIASTAMGNLSQAGGLYSTAMGTNTNASGDYSTAMGVGSQAQGQYSLSTGNLTTALGDFSSSFGDNTQANGNYSSSFGKNTVASASHTVAMGLGTIAQNPSSLVIGEYNDIYDDVLFQIGNGTGDGTDGTFRANAMTVYRNGHVLAWSYDLASDKRLKTDISEIEYGLKTVLSLNPVSYHWKNQKDKSQKTFGLIAQDVQSILNDIVNVGEDERETLSISYVELIPVLIKAIQEQNQTITDQELKINQLSADKESTLMVVNQLIARLDAMELELNSNKK